ncbi:hypothetical protein [Gracilibacillus thailandensis]|jgi:uncharacterized protein HemY|uniref:Uncharacterized protein n=1 Tax=Gracilibacillus thailandensis TaxID=563735 RepID=A0A6N7R547_9BACI|nr:hypothetical protein [Gracilibacillus thailandensis]MRI68347.1 hypothetical protein [Gracilibacillus thailandensis]
MDYIFYTVAILILIYRLLDHHRFIKKLSVKQIIGIGLSYIMYIGLATAIIYYGGNWLVSFISVNVLKHIIFFVIVAITIYATIFLLEKTLTKISNGIIKEQSYKSS